MKCLICGVKVEDEDGGPALCAKHYRCPYCGSWAGFYLDYDGINVCDKCGRTPDNRVVERAALKRANRRTCPHCGGRGWVEGESE